MTYFVTKYQPLFGGKVPKKQQFRPSFTGSVPIFRPDAGLPLPVPSGPGPLPLPSGLGPLPLPAGQGPIPMQLASGSYYYGNPSMEGFPSPFQQAGLPSFQPPRPFQTAPSVSYGTAQPMTTRNVTVCCPFHLSASIHIFFRFCSLKLPFPTATI